MNYRFLPQCCIMLHMPCWEGPKFIYSNKPTLSVTSLKYLIHCILPFEKKLHILHILHSSFRVVILSSSQAFTIKSIFLAIWLLLSVYKISCKSYPYNDYHYWDWPEDCYLAISRLFSLFGYMLYSIFALLHVLNPMTTFGVDETHNYFSCSKPKLIDSTIRPSYKVPLFVSNLYVLW